MIPSIYAYNEVSGNSYSLKWQSQSWLTTPERKMYAKSGKSISFMQWLYHSIRALGSWFWAIMPVSWLLCCHSISVSITLPIITVIENRILLGYHLTLQVQLASNLVITSQWHRRSAMGSQIMDNIAVCSMAYSGQQWIKTKLHISGPLVKGFHQWSVMWITFPNDDVIMMYKTITGIVHTIKFYHVMILSSWWDEIIWNDSQNLANWAAFPRLQNIPSVVDLSKTIRWYYQVWPIILLFKLFYLEIDFV